MTEPLYMARNLRRRFGDREVLNIPELTLFPSRIYGLLGPNGAGKSTLMRLLAFLDTPTEGEIVFRGESVRPDQMARRRSRVVWAPQTPVLFSGSLLYNVEYPLRLKGVGRAFRRETALALLESVDLARLAQAPARRLSGGEAQRASIARALAAGAEVILFDEPTASVDFRSRGEIIRLIRRLRDERGLSILVTTHDRELAAELCQECISLFEGRIVSHLSSSSFSGPPATAMPDDGRAAPLPCAGRALPGRLLEQEGRLIVRTTAGASANTRSNARTSIQADGCGESTEALLIALAHGETGITLRLAVGGGEAGGAPAGPGFTLDILLTDGQDIFLAKRLTLETNLRVLL